MALETKTSQAYVTEVTVAGLLHCRTAALRHLLETPAYFVISVGSVGSVGEAVSQWALAA